MCENEFAREDLDDKEKHHCQKLLKQKLDDARANVAKTEKELASAKANTENEKRRQEDLQRANDDYKRRIADLEKRVKESEEQEAILRKKVQAQKLVQMQIEQSEIETKDMIQYNLSGSTIECHSQLANGGGTGIEFPKELLNGNKTKWYAIQKCQEGPYGWVHIKFVKPLLLNGFGLTSANDC